MRLRRALRSEVAQFAFNQQDHAPRIDAARAKQPAFAAEHALVHLLVGAPVLAAPPEGGGLAEIELRQVAGRADGRAGPAADAGLQLGHLAQNLVALAQVVAVEVDGTGLRNRISEIDGCHKRQTLRYSMAASAATVPSLRVSPMFLGAVMQPA